MKKILMLFVIIFLCLSAVFLLGMLQDEEQAETLNSLQSSPMKISVLKNFYQL